jgi:hypothetical protein
MTEFIAKQKDLGAGQSFDGSSGLFSFGFTIDLTTMNLFSRSNQNGARINFASPES